MIYYIINKGTIDRLEELRLKLHSIADQETTSVQTHMQIMNITADIWPITHRKYKSVTTHNLICLRLKQFKEIVGWS